jgi:peptide deformylase
VIQHEIDHLDGILFLDHLSLVKRQILLARYRREHKDDTSFIKEVPEESASPE